MIRIHLVAALALAFSACDAARNNASEGPSKASVPATADEKPTNDSKLPAERKPSADAEAKTTTLPSSDTKAHAKVDVVTPATPTSAAAAPEPASGEPAKAPVAPAKPTATSLIGAYGFDWLNPSGARCQAMDETLAKRIANAKGECEQRSPDEAFEPTKGPWHACTAGKQEWLLFADEPTCKDQLEAMNANGP